MYGTPQSGDTPTSADLAAVYVDQIPNRAGQELQTELNRLLNPSATDQPRRYSLGVSFKETVNTFAVERAGFARRANVEVSAKYSLVDDATGNRLLAGSSRAVSGYSVLDNDFSTYVAAGDARNRAIVEIAYDIRNRLAGYFSNTPADSSQAVTPQIDEVAQPE
ncbi:MAG: hypothetical protein IPK66_01105 [Rhodospirillales bacterium]|nr:hypothetical protein [Rhodospirillales bacterium]